MTISRRRILRLSILLLLLASLSGVATLILRAAIRPPAEEAAANFLRAALTLDSADGRETWESRVRPLTTERGWAFWEAAIGQGFWNAVEQREYSVESVVVEQVRTAEQGEGDVGEPMRLIEAQVTVAYRMGDLSAQSTETYRLVMVERDGQWLFDGLPWEGDK